MGYMRHHSIAVTSWKDDAIKDLREKALEIFSNDMVTEIMESNINGYHTFFISPDGSKERWPESKYNDVNRGMFMECLNLTRDKSGYSSIDYCEFFYGDDEGESKIVNHSGEINLPEEKE